MIFTCITKKSGEAASISAFHAWERGTASAALGCFRKHHKCASLSLILPSLFHTMSALSLPPYRHPERSRGIFIALPPYAHMRPRSNDTLVLPFSPFPHPRFTGLQEISLHFGPHDTRERRIVLYRFSYRYVELCLFEALYPAPSARSFYILMHRHRPTHCPHNPHRTRFHSFIQSRGRHAPGLALNQFTQSKKHQP